jgi:hypothetical protein
LARVTALIPDLLFGSKVVAELRGAGHEVRLASTLAPDDLGDLLIVDLTAEVEERIASAHTSSIPKKLAFYSHVEAEVRAVALEAGFDLVVPRSRMAREGGALVERLLASAQRPGGAEGAP